MLHLNFALNFEQLADEMMNEISSHWEKPMSSPIVIFPDLALEQWFKLRWLEKYGVLTNLKTMFLDKFLFESLNDNPESVKRLTPEILRNVLLGWLETKADASDKYNWELLGEDVLRYLQANEGSVDLNRLHDFAAMISDLFLQYETSRPSEFWGSGEGIIRKWQADEVFFTKDKTGREVWQKKIYSELFVEKEDKGESLMERISHRVMGKNKKEISYLSLPELYERHRDASGEVQFSMSSDMPIFLFWHAGMGQFYRMAIHEYSMKHEVYAYIQNPCMEFWEDEENGHLKFKKDIKQMLDEDGDIYPDDENNLLKAWGRAGRDNIRLWCEAVDYDFNGIEAKEQEQEQEQEQERTLLHKVQWMVANRQNPASAQNQTENEPEFNEALCRDGSLSLLTAPTAIREIEAVHSKICRLMLEENVSVQDILVVAPDINRYRTAIYQVFDQEKMRSQELKTERRGQKKEEEVALYIPFTIIDGAARDSLTGRALRNIFKVIRNKSLSRIEFFELVRNKVVQSVRGISAEEIAAWETWIKEMNVYRDRPVYERNEDGWQKKSEPSHDWEQCITRLMMSMLSEERVNGHEDVILPYSNMDSHDNGALYRFVTCVKDLEQLREYGRKNGRGLTEKALFDYFVPMLNKWISMTDSTRELAFENMIYQSVMDSIEHLKYQYAAGLNEISWEILEEEICGAAENSECVVGSVFVNGVTFMNFTSNRVIPVKHIFMLGMDAGAFPGSNETRTLDLRQSEPWPGDVASSSRNRYAFLCQLMCTGEGFHISYVNKDLKKDAPHYPSSVIGEIEKFIGKGGDGKPLWQADEMKLDEERDWSELFTGRECRNRELCELLMKGADGKEEKRERIDRKEGEAGKEDSMKAKDFRLPERVSVWQIRKYLEDPFQLRISMLLERDDGEEDVEKIMYEPIMIEERCYTSLVEELALIELRAFDDGETKCQEQNTKIDAYFNELKEMGFLPSGMYSEVLKKRILTYKDRVVEQIGGNELLQLSTVKKVDIEMKVDLGEGKEQKWQLTGGIETHSVDDDLILSVSLGSDDDKISKYLKCYVTGLALLVEQKRRGEIEGDEEKEMKFWVSCAKGKKRLEKNIKMSANEAENILNEIYRQAFVDGKYEAAPISVLEEEWKNEKKDDGKLKLIESLDALINKLEGENGEWKYFKKGKIFDKQKDIGYEEDRFKEKWGDVKERRKKLVEKIFELKSTKENDKSKKR